MFKRRHARPTLSRIRHAIWPESGWSRAFQYIGKRAIRIKASPHAIAVGIAAGAFASFTPFVGFHTAIAIAIAWVFGGSFIAGFLGTFVGNPLTFPLIWATSHRLGVYLLGGRHHREPDLTEGLGLWERSFDGIWPVIKPMLVGGVPLGILAGLAIYFPTRYIVGEYQRKRAERRAKSSRRKAQGEVA